MRICLVGATHPCHNPRLVREADTLAEAGHEVRVVAPSYNERLAGKDLRLMQTRTWRLQQVDYCPMALLGRLRALLIRGRRRLASEIYPWLSSQWCAELAYLSALPELKRLAASESADWFVAHAQAALPVAAHAAGRWKAKLGFDCEDLLARGTNDPVKIVEAIERQYLSRCASVSAPTQAMANELRLSYGVEPIVLYNVFPLKLARGILPPSRRPRSAKIKLHWFSQVIGPGRGIEDAVMALQWLKKDVELHLRGTLYDSYRSELNSLAARHGVSSRLFFYAQVDHDVLIQTLAEFDIGLALERPTDRNYSLTITNKVFSYLLAGLPVIATETPGHNEAMGMIPGKCAASYPAGDSQALACNIERWVSDAEVLQQSKSIAWEAARNSFCWDRECTKFLNVLQVDSYAGRSVEASATVQ